VTTDAEELAALRRENAQLRQAFESRVIIEQAKGAISARRGVTPDEGFRLMRRLARSQRRDLHECAAEVVGNGGDLGRVALGPRYPPLSSVRPRA
jgi:AmiR/NasT family two-component response regulator